MQRYDLEDVRVHGEPWRVMIAHPDGEWVRYEDAAAEIERLTAERDEARQEILRLHAAIYTHRAAIEGQTDECLVDRDLWAAPDAGPPPDLVWRCSRGHITPVHHDVHDSNGVPRCETCWEVLTEEPHPPTISAGTDADAPHPGIPPEGIVRFGWPPDLDVQQIIIGHGVPHDSTPFLRYYRDGQIDLIGWTNIYGVFSAHDVVCIPTASADTAADAPQPVQCSIATRPVAGSDDEGAA